jgi:hypothetical protein
MTNKIDVENNLGKLPKGLKDTYSVIWDDILAESGTGPSIAKVALMWIFCACRPLPPDELAKMVSRYCFKTLPSSINIDIVLKCCHNLLILDDQLNTVRFAHLSVLEHLEENHFGKLNANDLSLLMDAKTQLSSANSSIPNQPPEPFTYPILYWLTHIQNCVPRRAELGDLLREFLIPSISTYADWYKNAQLCLRNLGYSPAHNVSLMICSVSSQTLLIQCSPLPFMVYSKLMRIYRDH